MAVPENTSFIVSFTYDTY